MFPLEQFFLTRDFPIFSSSSSFFFFFFLSHRPSALRKCGKGLIFTPNISTGNGGVHRHQAIMPFLSCSTTQQQITGPSTSHHRTTPFYNCHTFPRTDYIIPYIALITCVLASGLLFPSLQLWAASTAA